MQTKHLPVVIEKADSPDYDARFVLSASSPDRVNDTIDPAAYEPFLGKQIIALWQHDSSKPFGSWNELRMRGKKLIGDLKVAGTNLGAMIRQLLEDGVPLGASIGFAPKEFEPNKQGGLHFTEIELLEVSVVSVPAHPLATQLAKHFDSSQSLIDEHVAASGLDKDPDAVIRKAKAAILSVNKLVRKQK